MTELVYQPPMLPEFVLRRSTTLAYRALRLQAFLLRELSPLHNSRTPPVRSAAPIQPSSTLLKERLNQSSLRIAEPTFKANLQRHTIRTVTLVPLTGETAISQAARSSSLG